MLKLELKFDVSKSWHRGRFTTVLHHHWIYLVFVLLPNEYEVKGIFKTFNLVYIYNLHSVPFGGSTV